jgi:transposase
MPLLTKPLSRQERQAVTLRRQGKSNDEIAEALMVTNNHVATVLTLAKRKGAVFPMHKPGRKPHSVPIERLVHIRTQLRQAGYRDYGMTKVIAERVGLTTNCVKVRLWKHDHKPQGVSQ